MPAPLCPSGATDNLGRRVSHPPGTTTGACEGWHVGQEQVAWEHMQRLPAYWDGEGWDAEPASKQRYREFARYRDYRA